MNKVGYFRLWKLFWICLFWLPLPILASDSEAVATEKKLLKGLQSIQTFAFDQGLTHFASLAHQLPSYQLAQMLKADLYAIKAGRMDWVQGFHAQNKAQSLLMEAKLRWQGHLRAESQREYWENLLGQYVLKTSQEQHLLIVDSLAHRIYIYQTAENGYQEVANFYVTLGQEGIGKQFRGDKKTPIGIYRIDKTLADDRLPELYGVGALTLDYPNLWDQLKGRTGSGIWLHGTPRTTYSRAPLSSRGCVVLNNSAMDTLLHQYQLPPSTPVIITEGKAALTQRAHDEAEKALVLSQINRWLRSQQAYQVDWQKVSVYVYPGEKAVYYVEFPTESGDRVEQYWQRQPDVNQPWQLVYEAIQPARNAIPMLSAALSTQ